MFAVVEHDQAAAQAQAVDERLERVLPGRKLDGHGPGDGRRNLIAHGYRSELNQPGPLFVLTDRALGDFDSEPGLSDPTGPCQRHKVGAAEQGFERFQVGFPTDQAGQALGKVVILDVPRGQPRRSHRGCWR